MTAEILNSIIIGIITGLFSGGAIWGVIKTELRYLRRDLDSIRQFLRRKHDVEI